MEIRLIVCVLVYGVPAFAGMKPLSQVETEHLIDFSNDFNGVHWKPRCWPSAWKAGMDGCSFPGVSCSGDTNGTYVAVVSIDLRTNNIAGNVSTSRLFSQFAGASFYFEGNNLSGPLPNPCNLLLGSPAYNVNLSQNGLTSYDGSGMNMVSNLNLSQNQIRSPVKPFLFQLEAEGFFINSFDISHNRLVGDIASLGGRHSWEKIQTPSIDFSDNCLAGSLSWLNRSWYDKQGFSYFDLSDNYWTDAPTWCATGLCRPETRTRAEKGCPPAPQPTPAPPPPPTPSPPPPTPSAKPCSTYKAQGAYICTAGYCRPGQDACACPSPCGTGRAGQCARCMP
jgi:hypothetical protein